MTDHANELRRHARKIPHPQGETPGVMLRAADEIECLRAKIAEMEKQEPVAEWVDGAFDQYPYLRWREPYKAIVGAKLYTKLYALPGAKGE